MGEHCLRTAEIGVRSPLRSTNAAQSQIAGHLPGMQEMASTILASSSTKGERRTRIVWNNLKRASSKGRATVFHSVDAGSIPAARSVTCGGSSVVESERAKLGMGARFSSTALCFWFHEPDLWRGTWSAKPRVRVRFPVGSPQEKERSCSCPRRPAEGPPSSKRHCAGSTPAEGSGVRCSRFAMSPSC